jgi:hypothetical protein
MIKSSREYNRLESTLRLEAGDANRNGVATPLYNSSNMRSQRICSARLNARGRWSGTSCRYSAAEYRIGTMSSIQLASPTSQHH